MTRAHLLAVGRGYASSRSRAAKRFVALAVDAVICALAWYAAVFLRLGHLPSTDSRFAALVSLSLVLSLPTFWAAGIYREIFSQAGVRAIANIARACVIYAVALIVLLELRGLAVPRTLGVIQPLILFVGIVASRLVVRSWLFGTDGATARAKRRVLIYGAGSAGRQLSGAIAQSSEIVVLGYFDDDPALIGSVIDGRRIHHPAQMREVVETLRADEILLAVPSASQPCRNQIIARARSANVHIRTLPGLMDIAHGRVEIGHIRELAIEELLGRVSVEADVALMSRAIRGRIVLVTGAGGSIGRELCRQLAALEPTTLLLFDLSEHALYEMHRELEAVRRQIEIVPLLGSVCDEARVEEIIGAWRPDTIYHAAAYKHVPLVEHNPAEGVRTNVFGTFTVARVAARMGVRSFVLVSTDKAVRPTSVMGATKRAAELVLQALNQVSPQTRFAMVRFGNVLGSSGSVVPLFREQIRAGGPLTLTDRRITRYFMTVAEASELVLQAGAMADGGEVFVLDMGDPVRIADLASTMIELSGLTVRDETNPDGDVEIVEIGLRSGEKLYEELLIGDNGAPTGHPRILKADEPFIPIDQLSEKLELLAEAVDSGSRVDLIAMLRELVPEFEAAAEPVDWIYLQDGTIDGNDSGRRAATST